MKNSITETSRLLIDFANKFGLIVIATIISMIARAVYKGTSISRLLLKIPISAIIGIVVAVLLQEYTEVSINTTIISCTIVGAYSGEVSDGIEQLIRWVPEFIKKVFSSKFNINDKEEEQ